MTTNCTCPSEELSNIERLRCTSALQRLQQQNICKGTKMMMMMMTTKTITMINKLTLIVNDVNNAGVTVSS